MDDLLLRIARKVRQISIVTLVAKTVLYISCTCIVSDGIHVAMKHIHVLYLECKFL